MKYGEDKICDEIKKYIESTYSQHYSTTKDGFQVQDMLRHLGIDKDFCQANAIKYLARYGKKNGKNRKDLLKAIHYIVLLMTSEDEDNDDNSKPVEISEELFTSEDTGGKTLDKIQEDMITEDLITGS